MINKGTKAVLLTIYAELQHERRAMVNLGNSKPEFIEGVGESLRLLVVIIKQVTGLDVHKVSRTKSAVSQIKPRPAWLDDPDSTRLRRPEYPDGSPIFPPVNKTQ